MRTPALALLAAGALATAQAGPARAADRRPFDVQDLVTLQRVSDPRPSPDGKQVVYVLRTTDLEANRGRTDLWLTGIDGKGARRLTTSPENESSPRWSPDGKAVYFLSARGGPQQVWRLRLLHVPPGFRPALPALAPAVAAVEQLLQGLRQV